jgi:methionine-rich copper-binding protein CopC
MFRPLHIVLLAVGLAAPAPVLAHAILIDSTPPSNGTVAPGQVAFMLKYNSRIDRARSRLTLVGPDKAETRLTIGTDGPEDVMTTTVDAKPGANDIRWQVLAVDGHITRGDVPFTVKAP